MNKNKLIIFVKNAVLGAVKSRLAASIGEENALQVYRSLLKQTNTITHELADIEKIVYYSSEIEEEDLWSKNEFEKEQQQGSDLGERMKNAFEKAFMDGAERVVIIGSDCYDLTSVIIDQAFNMLESNQTVIGPAADGGYYLLGMSTFQSCLFDNMEWGTDSVFDSTISKLTQQDTQFRLLPVLRDVDRKEDIPTSLLHLMQVQV